MAANVSINTKKIQIVFSKSMKEKYLSKNGKEHFPLKNIVDLGESKTTLVIKTTDLQNNTEYNFYITDRATKSENGYSFDTGEYKISFKTEKK